MRYDIICLLTHAEATLWRWVERHEERHPETVPDCTDNILCCCERRNCPGHTIDIKRYTKGIKNA